MGKRLIIKGADFSANGFQLINPDIFYGWILAGSGKYNYLGTSSGFKMLKLGVQPGDTVKVLRNDTSHGGKRAVLFFLKSMDGSTVNNSAADFSSVEGFTSTIFCPSETPIDGSNYITVTVPSDVNFLLVGCVTNDGNEQTVGYNTPDELYINDIEVNIPNDFYINVSNE